MLLLLPELAEVGGDHSQLFRLFVGLRGLELGCRLLVFSDLFVLVEEILNVFLYKSLILALFLP